MAACFNRMTIRTLRTSDVFTKRIAGELHLHISQVRIISASMRAEFTSGPAALRAEAAALRKLIGCAAEQIAELEERAKEMEQAAADQAGDAA